MKNLIHILYYLKNSLIDKCKYHIPILYNQINFKMLYSKRSNYNWYTIHNSKNHSSKGLIIKDNETKIHLESFVLKNLAA